MLVLAADVEGERTGNRMSTKAGYVVEAFPIRSAIIIDDGLPEVVPIAQRSAGNSSHTRVHGIQSHAEIGGAAHARRLFVKLLG